MLLSYVAKEGVDNVRLLKLQKNVGKGGGVRRGMMYGRGKYLLFLDADGATKVLIGSASVFSMCLQINDMKPLEEKLASIEKDGMVCVYSSLPQL